VRLVLGRAIRSCGQARAAGDGAACAGGSGFPSRIFENESIFRSSSFAERREQAPEADRPGGPKGERASAASADCNDPPRADCSVLRSIENWYMKSVDFLTQMSLDPFTGLSKP
jgi:hypothetical protein